MSIRPESHAVEGRMLLQPHLVLVTNFRVDHGADVGWTREAAATAIAQSIPRAATVLMPEREAIPGFCSAVAGIGAELMLVAPGVVAAASSKEGWAEQGFPDNLDLVFAAARHLGLDDDSILVGIRNARQDIGALGIWRYPPLHDGKSAIVVNAFAANDPDSTAMAYDKVVQALAPETDYRWTGLLSLRSDRADRTAQWIQTLNEGMVGRFSRLWVCGEHARGAAWRIEKRAGQISVQVVRSREPDGIMREVLRDPPARGQTDIVFGFGNIGGAGRTLVEHWQSVGIEGETEAVWA